MIYSILGKTNLRVSKLGFGTLRLPFVDNKNVDEKKSENLVRSAYEFGVNYFDTSENYLNHQGEIILGKCVKGIRQNVIIGTKVSTVHLNVGVETHIQNCLQRLNTNYIDLFLIHAITDDNWEEYCRANTLEILDKYKKKGIIRHIGFSYHGSADFYKTILNEYEWEVSQIQLNYIDRNVQAGETGAIMAHDLGLGVSVMSPLKGGLLTNKLTKEMKDVLNTTNPDLTYAEWGLKWLYEKNYVDMVLNGISTMQELQQNVDIVNRSYKNKLSISEQKSLDKIREIFICSGQIPCTKCNYCSICSQKIKIPIIFDTYNHYLYDDDKNHYIAYYVFLTKGKFKCILCKTCEKKCPQKIKISNELAKIHKQFMEQTNQKMLSK